MKMNSNCYTHYNNNHNNNQNKKLVSFCYFFLQLNYQQQQQQFAKLYLRSFIPSSINKSFLFFILLKKTQK